MGTCKQVECLSASNIPFHGSIASGGLNLFHMEKSKTFKGCIWVCKYIALCNSQMQLFEFLVYSSPVSKLF